MTNVEVKLKLRESCISLDEEGTGWGLLNIGELFVSANGKERRCQEKVLDTSFFLSYDSKGDLSE